MAAAAKYRRECRSLLRRRGRVRWLRRRSACGVGVEEGVGSCRARRQRLGKRRDRAFGSRLAANVPQPGGGGSVGAKTLEYRSLRGGPLNAPDPRRSTACGAAGLGTKKSALELSRADVVALRMRGGCYSPAVSASTRRASSATRSGRCRPRACGPRPSLPASAPGARPRRCRRCRFAARPTSGRPGRSRVFAVAYVGHDFMGVAEGQAALDQVVGQVGGGGEAPAARRRACCRP